MPKFNKTEEELDTMFDKWLFALSNLARLQERPKALQERIFTRLFEQAEVARFTPGERNEYVASKKDYFPRICSACSLVLTCLPAKICSMMPDSLIMKVVRIVPMVFLPYIDFSPQAPIASSNV